MPATTGCCWRRVISRGGCSRACWRRSRCCRRRRDKARCRAEQFSMTTPGTQGELSPESMGKTASSAVGSPPDAKPAPHCTTGNTADQNRLKPYKGKPFELSNELKLKVKKEIPA